MSDTSKSYEDSWQEHELNNGFIDWQHWVHRMESLNSEQASLLMNGLGPNLFTGVTPKLKREDIDRALDLSMKMKALADSENVGTLTPTGWKEWAECAGFYIHDQFKSEVETLRHNSNMPVKPESEDRRQTCPQPLTTSEIAEYFYDLRWKSSEEARKALGKKPAWLKNCVAIPGIQGRQEIRWHPVQVGAALYSKGFATAKQIRSCFRRFPRLKEWEDLWLNYEADYISTD